MINLAAVVPVTEAEGPGKRFAVWVQGCPFRCKGCCNPQYLSAESEDSEMISTKELATDIIARKSDIEGVTFIGGEPFSQAAGLAEVAEKVRQHDLSVMVFSGYMMEELTAEIHPDYESRKALLSQIDLLVDGRYERDLHVTNRRWIGSSNQEVHFLTDRYIDLKENWPGEANTIEIRMVNGEITFNGFPHPEITAASLRRK